SSYFAECLTPCTQAGRFENAIGRYRLHLGYGCWPVGIGVNTQLDNQNFQDSFVVVVVDAGQFYPLEMEICKSTLEIGMLWKKYWVNTLSQSPLSGPRRNFSKS
ncbi:hypothetical protein DFH09DRAFT_940097, partial [Mycena vulgaris]